MNWCFKLANYRLSHTKSGYKFSQNTKLHGLASMFANDTVSAVSFIDEIGGNLLLKKHTFRQTGREKNRNEDIDILWQAGEDTLKGNITGVVRSNEINLETNSEVWEALSFQIPLMIEASKDISEYPYKAILKGKIDTYNFILKSSKKFDFANSEYTALQMVRTNPHKNRQLHIWLLPQLNNMPILIETYRDGREDSRLVLESVQFNNERPLIANTMDDEDDF